MSPSSSPPIAIIGAGLSGCSLALALSSSASNSPPSLNLYELRTPSTPTISSGIILTPNGLSILSHLGVLSRIESRGWNSRFNTVRNDRDELVSKTEIASVEKHGYCNLRVWREVLLREMREMLRERGMSVREGWRFEGVVEERGDEGDKEGAVVFKVREVSTGEEKVEKARLLIGADGIYSSVRKYISDVRPVYTGTLGVIAHIQRADVAWPFPDFEPAVTIQGRPGAIFMIPEDPDACTAMIGTQIAYPDQTREEWERMSKDEALMLNFFTARYEEWPEGSTARKVVDALRDSQESRRSLYLWPFLSMPRMRSWCSEKTGRVLVVGDAAHALPPSSGQGVNQALEDVWSLVLLLGKSRRGLKETLGFWQGLRQERVDGVMDFAMNATNVQRMPEKERLKLEKSRRSVHDRDWIYKHGIDEKVEAWLNA